MTEPRQSRAPRKQTTQPRAAFTPPPPPPPPPPLSSGDLKAPVSDQSSRDNSAKGLRVVDVRARVCPRHWQLGNRLPVSQAPLHDRRRRGAREVDDVREHGRGGGLLRGLAGVAGDRRFMLRRSEARCPHIRKQLMLMMSIISALRRKI
jgi:hypothetical protein